MKFLFYVAGLVIPFVLGLIPAIEKPRSRVMKVACLAIISATVFLALYPPLVGTFQDAVRAKALHLVNQDIRVICSPDWSSVDSTGRIVTLHQASGLPDLQLHFADSQSASAAKSIGSDLCLRVQNGDAHNDFTVLEVCGARPAIMLPYIPALEERSRVMFFHVPMSWVAFLAFFIALMYSFRFLRSSDLIWETKAANSAAIGTLFCVLAYVTGAVWAKFNWGHFFNWDSREISILILLLIYGAYFALRSSIAEPDRRARLSSVYAIVACVAALFLMFIVSRITQSLHPGSSDDSNSGPILSPQQDTIDLTKAMIFSLSLSGFTLLYFWLLSIGVRISLLDQRQRLATESTTAS